MRYPIIVAALLLSACGSQTAESNDAVLADAARSVERGGADFILMCTNTMHKVAGELEQACGIPLLHIADATADDAKAALDAYTKVANDAVGLHLPVMNQTRFLYYTGYFDASKR